MSDLINLVDQVETYEVGREQVGYSKVILNVTDSLYYQAGNDTGETLEVDCPFGTQAICNSILESVRGYAYKPYKSDGALLDPSAELGDSVAISGNVSVIASSETEFGKLMSAKISAPSDDDIDSEYPYKSSEDRKITRTLANVQSELIQQASEISAKVSQTGGTQQSFSWSLTHNGFILANNGSQVFKADANGIKVTGEIHATSGFIGTDSDGFNITPSAIYKTLSSYSAKGTGVYIGTDGINLGGKFKVDQSGNISATNATFNGYVNANKINYGDGTGGYFSGNGLSGGSISSGKCNSGINSSLGHGDSAYSQITASTVQVANLKATGSLSCKTIGVDSHDASWIKATDYWGETIYVLARR